MPVQKEDLTVYSDQELSLRVFNDEGLYMLRRRSYLMDILNDCFIFSEEQAEVLKQDLEDDEKS